MQRVSDIAVLDFCEWLSNELRRDGKITPELVLDALSNDQNESREQLIWLARMYLYEEAPCKRMMTLFLNSKEFNQLTRNCCDDCHHFEDCRYFCSPHFYYCQYFKHAFFKFYNQGKYKWENINAEDLANRLIHNLDLLQITKEKSFATMRLMISSSVSTSEEINFLEWLQKHSETAYDVKKIPSIIFEELVDRYVKENSKSDKIKKVLLKSYQETGLKKILKRIQTLSRIEKRRNKSMDEILKRYFSEARYKCIILPLSDPISQKSYEELIHHSWDDLNTLSGDYLDIYYSEQDTGKSGYDISQRIRSLPDHLRLAPPCIVLWKNDISKAQSISIRKLDNMDLCELIRSIVDSIKAEKFFTDIVEEAESKVKELRDENRSIIQNINKGTIVEGNVTGNVHGEVHGNIHNVTINYDHVTIEDFDKAFETINSSDELDDGMKTELNKTIETAKNGIEKQDPEQCNQAKNKFNSIKPFLLKIAPKTIEVLANIATIASFFGLSAISH